MRYAIREIPPDTIRQIKAMAAHGAPTKQISRHLGISISSVHKIRQGFYDARLAEDRPAPTVFCPNCRAHVIPPCVLCSLPPLDAGRPPRPAVSPETIRDPNLRRRLGYSVHSIGLAVRIANHLEDRGYHTVGHLLALEPESFLRIPNISHKSLAHVRQVLARLGFVAQSAAKPRPISRRAA